jgi:hypothetical protein
MERELPPRSVKLVKATPIHRTKSGVKACVEFTIYSDGHAGIAVCRVEGAPHSRQITQADALPLNHVKELHAHLLAVVDHLEAEAARIVNPHSEASKS